MEHSWFGSMLVCETYCLGQSYRDLLGQVISCGDPVEPRGLKTREARPLVLRLQSPYHCIVRRPGFNQAYMWMEIAQYLAGDFDRELLARYSPRAAEMNNAYGSYGPRIGEQLLDVERELKRDGDSRRGMVYVGRPEDLRYAKDLDMVCTVGWHFQRRKNLLEMTVFMRSWDLVWGLSYDIPAFVSVQLALARALDLDPGSYTHVASSGHVYERHWDLVTRVETTSATLPCVGSRTGMDDTRKAARYLLAWERKAPFGDVLKTDAAAEEPLRTWRPALEVWSAFGEHKNNNATN